MSLRQQVLVVDDSKIMRRIINGFLRRMGFTAIHEAAGGREALRIINEGGINIIISDWSMQGTTGIDILRAVRENEETRNLPFVMITAEGQLYHILKAFRAGVSQYLVKPFDFEQFQYVLEKIC